jgi:hypothetical protein
MNEFAAARPDCGEDLHRLFVDARNIVADGSPRVDPV